MKKSKNNYNIRDFRQTIMKYLSAQYETSNGEKIRGDDAMLNALFNIIAHGDQKEKMKAIKLYKELMELLAKQGLL